MVQLIIEFMLRITFKDCAHHFFHWLEYYCLIIPEQNVDTKVKIKAEVGDREQAEPKHCHY